MPHRRQQTISRSVELSGIGFFTGADVRITFRPAAENHGIVFRRVDLPGSPSVPARLEYVAPAPRRTVIRCGDASVEMIEHAMAALAGLRVDNCLVDVHGPEVPGFDGSALPMVQALLEAGLVEQSAEQALLAVSHESRTEPGRDGSQLIAAPLPRRTLAITYELDYGPRSPVPPQTLTAEITPEYFVTSIAYARTFALESEVAALRAAGIGQRVTEKDVLIFGASGPLGNPLRAIDECVRHKILDCLGDFALAGCDLYGHFRAFRTGHAQNHEIIRRVLAASGSVPTSHVELQVA